MGSKTKALAKGTHKKTQVENLGLIAIWPGLSVFISIGFQDVNDLLLICKSMVVVDNKTPLYRSVCMRNSSRLKEIVF